MNNVELLPLPDDLHHHHIRMGTSEHHAATRDYARACVEASTEALRVENERMAEALRGALEIFEWNAIGGEVRKHIEAVLTLHPTAAQENDHA